MSSYAEILAAKRVRFEARGLERVPDLHPSLFPHQRDVVDFLLRAGCGAAFLDTGLGKTFVALEWGRVVVEATGRPVLMLAPLAVGPQHAREAALRGIDATYVRERPARLDARIWITNYERLERFDPADFAGVILDESSILKSFTGKTTNALIEAFQRTPFRLAATATPAPNDHTELGQHAAFLGVMPAREMLMRWFINDTSTASQDWRLKGHAAADYWDWVASWARCIAQPSDLGHSDDGFALPALDIVRHVVAADLSIDTGAERGGQARLFRMPELSATSIGREKRLTVAARADAIAAAVAADPGEPWIVWCDTNMEADALMARIPGAVEVRGDMRPEVKEDRLVGFSDGRVRVLVTKPSIAGFGLNWQHCARMAFVGVTDSFESYYQAVRRCWRFGQTRTVCVHIFASEREGAVVANLKRKEADALAMSEMLSGETRAAVQANVLGMVRQTNPYNATRPVMVPKFLEVA